ncbi:MAG: FAD:protein FMN transferase, partial [Isosphaeraceae bacterium]
YERSGGAFDVTVGPAVRQWRRARRDRKMPTVENLARARALTSSDFLTLDPESRSVRLEKPGMKLDLGGIAKGWASDEALKVLKRHGIESALVAGAGDVVVGGPPPGKDGWVVGVAPLENPDATPERYFSLRDVAISTSGDAERFVEIEGKRYSHIVDPRTALGVINRASVTIISREGATSDALATAVYALGPEKGLALVEETPGASCLIVQKNDAGVTVLESSRLKDVPVADPLDRLEPAARLSPR